jgi:excisionase family DNA binding protein
MNRFPGAEWLDLKALQQYACVSERTLRQWVHRLDNPLPAARVGAKILVRKTVFDRWLESHQVKAVDIGSIVEDLIIGIRGTN